MYWQNNDKRGDCNKREGVKGKSTPYCPRWSVHSQFITSFRGEQHGG